MTKHARILSLSVVSVFLLICAFVAGAFLAFRTDNTEAPVKELGGLPTFVFYTSPGATTPQIPFWSARNHGALSKLFNVKVELWKDVDSLKTVMLAGKGDLWLGHTEAFAYAKKQGAPVSLLAISAWKKNYLLSLNPDTRSLDTLSGKVAVTPRGTAVEMLLARLVAAKGQKIEIQPEEINQLAHDLSESRITSLVAPEPLVTLLLKKNPGLRVVENIEDAFSREFRGGADLPLAGIAVNSITAARYPKEIAALRDALVSEAVRLSADPAAAVANLPESFAVSMPREIVQESLARDLILVKPAEAIEDEIRAYLTAVDPSGFSGSDGKLFLDSSFIWKRQ